METKGDDVILTNIFFGGKWVLPPPARQFFFFQGVGVKFEEENHLGIALIFSVVAILDVTPCATTAQTALRGPISLRKDS